LGPIPNPQSPIPNPQSPLLRFYLICNNNIIYEEFKNKKFSLNKLK